MKTVEHKASVLKLLSQLVLVSLACSFMSTECILVITHISALSAFIQLSLLNIVGRFHKYAAGTCKMAIMFLL